VPPELGPAPQLAVSVQTEVVSWHSEYGRSYGPSARDLTPPCQLPVSGGAIAQSCLRPAQRTAAAEHELQEGVQGTRVVPREETTGWTSGARQYLGLVATAACSWLRVEPRRSHHVIEAMVGKGPRLVVSDYSRASRACTWLSPQWCGAQLSREATRLAEGLPPLARNACRERLSALYQAAVAAQSREGPQGDQARRTLCQRLGRRRACPRYAGDPELARRQRRWQQEFYGYLACGGDPEVAPENNRAERDLRPAVRLRNRSFQTRSDAGEVAFAHGMSLTQTLRKQGLELEPWLRQALAAYWQGTPLPSLFVPEAHSPSLPN
jgi:transposase